MICANENFQLIFFADPFLTNNSILDLPKLFAVKYSQRKIERNRIIDHNVHLPHDVQRKERRGGGRRKSCKGAVAA